MVSPISQIRKTTYRKAAKLVRHSRGANQQVVVIQWHPAPNLECIGEGQEEQLSRSEGIAGAGPCGGVNNACPSFKVS